MAYEVGLVELRAWARQSHDTAKREGFPRVAGSISAWLSRFDRWQAKGFHTVELKPYGPGGYEKPASNTMRFREPQFPYGPGSPRNMNEAYYAGYEAGRAAGRAEAEADETWA